MNLKYLALLALMPVAVMAADNPVSVQAVAEKEELVVNELGQPETRLIPATTVVPGDEVVYTITFTNHGEAPADAVIITDPVPEHMRYVPGSAFGAGTDIRFSVDGGENWGTPEQLTVLDPDGTVRPARADDYTHIRWTMRNPLLPGKRSYARFRAQLR